MHWSNPSCVSVNMTLSPPQFSVASSAVRCGGIESADTDIVSSFFVVGSADFPPYSIITSSLPGSDSCSRFDGGYCEG